MGEDVECVRFHFQNEIQILRRLTLKSIPLIKACKQKYGDVFTLEISFAHARPPMASIVIREVYAPIFHLGPQIGYHSLVIATVALPGS